MVVIFNEPFGIGAAVMREVLDREVGALVVIDDAAALSVNALDDVLTSLLLADNDRLEELRLDETSSIDCGVFTGVFETAAGAVEVCS